MQYSITGGSYLSFWFRREEFKWYEKLLPYMQRVISGDIMYNTTNIVETPCVREDIEKLYFDWFWER